MIATIDAYLVHVLNDKFGIVPERIIYGQLPVARVWWNRYSPYKPGEEALPYVAFFRTIGFSETDKKAYKRRVVMLDDSISEVTAMKCRLSYTIEIMGKKVADQNEYMKKYMFWMGDSTKIEFTDGDGGIHKYGVYPNDPEDNSDLEEEEELGRFVRTTFTFDVHDAVMLDTEAKLGGQILDILARIHLYGGTTPDEGSQQIKEIQIVP